MSRYTFNPKIDPERKRRRRVMLGGVAISAVLCLGVGAFVVGCGALAGSGALNGAGGTPTPFKPRVVVYADGTAAPQQGATTSAPATVVANPTAATKPTAQGTAALAPTGAATKPAATVAPVANPAGSLPGIPDFVCPNPRTVTSNFGYGVQSNWPVGDIGFWNSVMAEKLKLNWTKAQVRWKDFEPAKGKLDNNNWQLLDAFTADANKKGLNILFGVIDAPAHLRTAFSGSNAGPPDNYAEAARFMSKLAARYKGCAQAIEVWNEMNLDREWTTPRGAIAGGEYVNFLKAVAPAIRQANPDMQIVMGALSPTGSSSPGKFMDDFQYMDQFVAAGGPALVDCVGVHLNGFNLPPDKAWNEGFNDPSAKFRGPFDNPNHSWSFKSTIEGYRQRTNKPICVTEFGWASMDGLKRKNGTPVQGAPSGFDFALDNTEKEQADYIVKAFEMLRNYGWVNYAIVFNLDYISKIGEEPDAPSANVAPYSIIRRDGSPRPAFDAIERMKK